MAGHPRQRFKSARMSGNGRSENTSSVARIGLSIRSGPQGVSARSSDRSSSDAFGSNCAASMKAKSFIEPRTRLLVGVALLGLRPVFQAQSRDPAELALVVRDQNQLPPDRLRRDQRVERTDGRARALELRAHARIRAGVARGELDDR